MLVCVALVAATLAAFAPVMGNGFVNYDDRDYVTANPHVLGGLSWESVAWAFRSGHAGNWHPLTWLSHMLDVQLFGLRAWGHHATSLLLHAANAVLLFLFLQCAMRSAECGMPKETPEEHPPTPHFALRTFWLCALVAGLFALHPLRVESVAWVAERKDVLSGFFFLLTLWAYVRHAECGRQRAESKVPGGPRTTDPASRFTFHASRFYFLALALFALGLMSKPMLVTLPFVLLLLDYWPLGRSAECGVRSAESLATRHTPLHRPTIPAFRLVLEKVPFFALAAASCVVTFIVQRGAGAVRSLETMPLEFRITNALISYVRYVGKMVWPAKLAVFYPAPAEWPALWVALAALGLAGVSVLALRRARRAPWFAFGWLWYGVTLLPVIGLVQVGQQAMADRYTYIPLIGLCVALVWGGADLACCWARRGIRPSPGGAGVLPLGGAEPSEAPRLAHGAAPGIGRAPALLAACAVAACGVLTWRQAGFWRDSTSLFEHALAVTRDNFVAHSNLGVVLLDQGKLAAAQQHFTEAVRIKSNYPEGLGNLALCRLSEGRTAEAEELLERALRARPSAPNHYNLANLLLQQGKFEEAQAQYEAALRLNPELIEAWFNLGVLEAKQGQPAKAARNYAEALRLQPAHTGAHLSLGALLAGEKKFVEAIGHFEAVLRATPDNLDAHFNLASALNAKGDYAGAAAQYAEVCRLHPEDVEARQGLALALLGADRMTEAVEQFREALRLRPDARMHHYLALVLDSQGRAAEALPHYRDAVRLGPDTALYLNDLAWFLATNPMPDLRDGAEAVRLAERARELNRGKEARVWGTLDAAYAEAGRFAEALATAAKARELALAAGQADIARQAEERMALYHAGKPYRIARPQEAITPPNGPK